MCLHLRSCISGMFLMGIFLCQKNSCFRAFPMYCPVQNLSMFVFWESVIVDVDQNLLDVSLSMFGFIVQLLILGNCSDIIFRLVSRSCLVMYVCRHLTGPLSGHLFGPGHVSFWKKYGVVCANSYGLLAKLHIFLAPSFASLSACSLPLMFICALTLYIMVDCVRFFNILTIDASMVLSAWLFCWVGCLICVLSTYRQLRQSVNM